MKATELMIGDWVDLSDVPNESIPCIVVELHTDELLVIQPNDKACDIVGYYMVRPIPLTAEILEKNGFVQGNQYWYLPNNGGPIEFSIDDDWECGKHYFGVCCGKPFSLNYVHELQHALRLCGLNELADNFKV